MTDLSNIITRLESLERRLSARDGEILVSCQEAARLLGKTPPTISRMIREGRLTKITIGESTGIRLSEIQRMKAQ